MTDSSTLREKGNEAFKQGNYDQALAFYSKALDTGPMKDSEKAVVFKNRAACYLKMNKFQEAAEDAAQSLELCPNDPKALFRRCQAYEQMGRFEEAFKDAVLLIKVDPQNKAVRPLFNKLNTLVQERVKQQNSTSNKVNQMFNIAFDPAGEHQKRLQGLNNLIVLSREEAGASLIMKQGGLTKLKPLLAEKDTEIQQGAVRVLATLAKGSKTRCAGIIQEIGMGQLTQLLSQAASDDQASPIALLMQNLITYNTGLGEHQEVLKKYEEAKKKGERTPYPRIKIDEESNTFLDSVFKSLVKMLVNSKTSAYGRDSVMELISKNVPSKTGFDWTKPFLETQGVENLLTVAGSQIEFKTLQVTSQSAMHASLALSTIYDDLINDKLREKFKEKCHEFFRDLFSDSIFESKIEAVAALSTLLQGPYEVGGMLLGLEGVTELMFTLASSDNVQYQKVAVEAIVSSASKKDKCSGILKDAVPILKKLYQSSEDHIKVRALVGLCKLGSFMGTDASSQPLAAGSTEKLSKICRKFLVNPTKDADLRKWATEGLAYLTLDADIKEELVNDTPALKSIFELAKSTERNTTYACVTVLVNCTNSYDKQDIMPELIELAKFAKQHVPEEHAKDKPEFVSGRMRRLADAGVINALVSLSDAESKNSREQISRVFMSISTEERLRGLIVQQGGVKALLNLMNNNTDNGVILASHALAKISVTSDPNFAFPGQRIYEVVRPLLSLLHADRTGLQNFEALLALTNLSSVSDSVRNRILTEKGLPSIEHYMFEDHQMLRRAATECMCNMVMSEKVQEMFDADNDRVKMLVLFAGEDDPAQVRAATGALAVLSSRPSVCQKIVQVQAWMEIFQVHAVSEMPDIQHRACHCLLNIMSADKELATLIVQSPMLEILMAVAKQKDPKEEKATQAAQEALQKAVEYGLIKENDKGNVPDQFLAMLRAQLAKVREEEERQRKLEEEEEEKKKKQEEEEKRKALESMNKEEDEEVAEEIVVDKPAEGEEYFGPKIRELTEEEVAQLEAEEKAKEEKSKESKGETTEESKEKRTKDKSDEGEKEDVDDEIDEEELASGDVWNDQSGLK